MEFKKDVSLKQFTTLEIGGKTDYYVLVNNLKQLKEALAFAKEKSLEILVIGGGSNLLVSDDGFRGLVIKNNLTGIKKNDKKVTVSSGTTLQELVDYTIKEGLGGMHKMTGIPGSVGGAVYGNAGAYGQTISDLLEEIVVLNPETLEQKTLSRAECQFSYRSSGLKVSKEILLQVTFTLPPGKPEELKKESQQVLEKRLAKYPPGIKCPGSFFKNVLIESLSDYSRKQIPKDRDYFGKVPAWYFLDEVGAKGKKLGKIEIADFHGNLFINTGDGSAEDFYNLAKEYFLKVKEKFGITLEPEVQLINLPPFN